ncbi:OLC1v1005028C1 [Oldenlandia corymbosa var. corymbosa]|uniref:OLC1v1005028C1 n=1 Tax=Oldenlandia corymbosa var. corymbosa TaxID=529605 RepID=A0AAV1DDW8_OLDCO|nr:OLC1v1005028C1 [Oldenlandia corymbosa var. corymbosa]
MLVEILEESIKNFGDLSKLIEIVVVLQLKEKKRKDIVISGNCVLRKSRKCQKDDVDQVLYFLSQEYYEGLAEQASQAEADAQSLKKNLAKLEAERDGKLLLMNLIGAANEANYHAQRLSLSLSNCTTVLPVAERRTTLNNSNQ